MSIQSTVNRQPAGTPTGGQFAAGSTSEASIDLVNDTNPAAVELVGEMSWAPSRFGQTATAEGPVLVLDAAVPVEHADDPAYLDDRFHRVQAFFEENYGAKLAPEEDRHVQTAHVTWEVEHEDAEDDELADLEPKTVAVLAGPHGGATRLAADLAEGPDGRTKMSVALAEHLARTDEEAKTPRDVVLTGEEDFWPHRTVDLDQKSLDYAVKTARDHIDITNRIRRVGARHEYIIAQTFSVTNDSSRLAVYDADAWTPPTSEPMLPWSHPDATPVAKVDMDGHVSLLTGNDALCRDCAQPLDDMASANDKGCCLACTGEWDDDRP